MNWRLSNNIDLGGSGRIDKADAKRQMSTAKDILRRFDTQPGVILADEVGMGKTFVALAVAASVVEATDGKRPVVVMVPSSVQRKWPKEWHVFRQGCLDKDSPIRASDPAVQRGSDFLKLLDDPPSRRQHVIFMTQGALTGSIQDPFIKLAIIRQALLRRQGFDSIRASVARWSSKLLGARMRNSDMVTALLGAQPAQWARVVRRFEGNYDDDPVPEAVVGQLASLELSSVREALQGVPLRSGPALESRLRAARRSIDGTVNTLWKDALKQMVISSPLLIMDEAHHLKNPWTSLAGLFSTPSEEGDDIGALSGVFDRMLFLTATPFQLGHQELLQVLHRFEAVRWKVKGDREAYREKLGRLGLVLDQAQTAALRLDDSWGRLAPDDLVGAEDQQWWWEPDLPGISERARQAALRVAEVDAAMRRTESEIRPWVVRHARPNKADRRHTFPGRSIIEGPADRGLEVSGRSSLPFLLAARAQALLAERGLQRQDRARAFFAEGLASSFESYRMTRLREGDALLDQDGSAGQPSEPDPDLAWYLGELDRALPKHGSAGFAEHPKIQATVSQVMKLWRKGEKVVVFCFYIETGRALRRHISKAMQDEFDRLGAEALSLTMKDREEVRSRLEALGDRFFDSDGRLRKVAEAEISGVFGSVAQQVDQALLPPAEDIERGIEVTIRFLRTTSFLLNHMDIADPDPIEAFIRAMDKADGSQLTLRDKIAGFALMLYSRVAEERGELLEALGTIQTGGKQADARLLDEGERSSRVREVVLPNVRLANGHVQPKTRERLMLAFNTPFFPEVLVASAVMAEGVDLHLNCRYVIHHDLDWNPSVLEQRTGRLDRLGSKSERSHMPVVVFEPYIEATQDEKQFRVVKDRERWFNIVMGERLDLNESATDRLSERVGLPDDVAQRLTMDLSLRRR